MARWTHPLCAGTTIDDMNENFCSYVSQGNAEYSSTGSFGNRTDKHAVITIDAKTLECNGTTINIEDKHEVYTLAGGSTPSMHNGYGTLVNFDQSGHDTDKGHHTKTTLSFSWTVTKTLGDQLNNKTGDLTGLDLTLEYIDGAEVRNGHILKGANLRLLGEIRCVYSNDQSSAVLSLTGWLIPPKPTDSTHNWKGVTKTVDKFNNLV